MTEVEAFEISTFTPKMADSMTEVEAFEISTSTPKIADSMTEVEVADSMTEVEAFNATSDWSSQSGSTSPTEKASGFGEFYYGSTHFNASALSLVVCCAKYGVYTAADTAQVLSQQQQHNPSLERMMTADDVIGLVRKAVRENSTAYQALKAAGLKSSLVREILAPMVDANFVRMRSFSSADGYEIKPTWYPRSQGPRPLRLPLSIRCEIPSEAAEDGQNKDSNRNGLEGSS